MRKHISMVVLLSAMLILAACGASSTTTSAPTSTSTPIALDPSAMTLTINDPWVRPAAMTGAAVAGDMATPMAEGHMSGGTSAAFMLITNSSSTADALIRAESSVAETVELHDMKMEDGVMKMFPVEKIDVPANGSVELKRGGLHVMLIGLRQDLKEGDMVLITLTFENAGTIQIEAPVRMPPME